MEVPVVDGAIDDGNSSDDGSYDDSRANLGGTLSGFGLAQAVVDTHAANELGLVRSEVQRLRAKVEHLEHEKEVMVDDFNVTTLMFLDRIRALESEKCPSDSRPQTAAILERVETTWGSSLASKRPTHAPEVLRIEEEDAAEVESSAQPATNSGRAPADVGAGGNKECGNCGQQVPTANFTTHSVFCYRNNFRCDACEEVLSVSEKENHIELWTDPERFIDAAKVRDLQTLQTMCAHGADFQTAVHPTSGDTVLHMAAANSDIALVELCMGYGVDVDPMNNQNETPMHLAASNADMPVIRLLVELGAHLDITNGTGETPLILVCRRGVPEIARYLVEKKADVEAKTRLGDTPLQIAQRLGFQETVLALSMAGATLRPGTPKRERSGSRNRGGNRSGSPKPPDQLPTRRPSGNALGGCGYPPRVPPVSR